jgi:acetyl esterase/lipase
VALPVSATYDTEWGSADCRSPEEQRHLLATRGRSLGDGPSTVARLDLHFAPDAPLEPAPSPALTASPTAGLGDFQSVTVQGTAFEPTSAVAVKVCRSGDTSNCDVRNGETVAAGLDGSIATEITVWPSWTRFGWGDATDCRVAPGCVIAATPHGSPTAAATLPLSFGPSSPTRGRYLDPVFDQVQVDGDVVYRQTVDNEGRPIQLKMDFFRPAGDTATNRPVMMWMHGGFFTAGDKSTMHDDAIASAKRGYVGVAIQYRLHRGGTEGWRDSFRGSLDAYDDATAAVQWLQAHAAQYGVNPDAIVAGDFSAGAITALNLGYLPGQRGPASSLVAAVVSRGGILYTPPAAGDPPTIAFHGSVDDVTDFATMRDACDLASAVDVACELVVYDGQRHTSGDLDDVHRRTSDFVAEHVLRPLGYLDP